VRDIPFLSVGDDVSHYVSATIEISGAGVKSVKVARTELEARGPDDADLVALRARWQDKLDRDLGEVIAYTRAVVPATSPLLRTWVATALREQTSSDAALINRRGIRAELPKGAVTSAHLYSMIPFENAVLTVKVKGEDLEKLQANPEAVLVLPPGKLEKGKEYQLATTDYLYFGGDGLGLEAIAPNPELTGQVWQTPVISWLKKLDTSQKKPLERAFK
jgi:2',3'-cyclic-nucleotide 2'-phosphodiesterase (5'-nucleotidase family)